MEKTVRMPKNNYTFKFSVQYRMLTNRETDITERVWCIEVYTYTNYNMALRGFYRSRGYSKISPSIFEQFIDKFCEDLDFRNSLFILGKPCKEVRKRSDVNCHCIESIQAINAMDNLSDDDYMNLRTYGNDFFSSLKRDQLMDVLDESELHIIQESLNEAQWDSAFRWSARGLKVEYAIQKALFDQKRKEEYDRMRNQKSI